MKKEDMIQILKLLDKEYGIKPVCYLNYSKDYELLIATILAAQCTDARVNIVTEKLFKKYKTIKSFAASDLKQLEKDVKQTGFYKNKAKHIKECMTCLMEKYNSKVPDDIEELIKLPGVGRKTANVILTHIYGIDSIVVDTHVKRLSKLIGFTTEVDPTKIEYDLMKRLPRENWQRINSQLMALGRTYCNARKKNCIDCYLKEYCKTGKKVK